ncbi:MAG: GGDEF domain-containing protein [Arenimonas sp.]|uniref:GGDEF domain-containing protein n=1 Tax=Arenimonas sp. TaxID=1872635 RepID=UPI0025BC39A4|nr:GGDEF domain-containing protein [Arenimonas sp.]MBW8368382.1 GGDEF domain-containing protein [Arenimonas sp.]
MATSWTFDIRSALLVGALLTLMIGLVLLVVGRALPAAYRPSVRWWVGATLLQPAGFALLSLRDTLSPILSIVVANAFVVMGLTAYVVALRRFHGLPARHGPLAAAVAAMVAASFYWGLVDPDLTSRLIVVSIILAGVLGTSAAIIYRHGRGPVRHVAGVPFAAAAAIMAYRAVVLLFDPSLVTTVFQVTHVQLLTYAVASVLPVIATIGFLLLCTERSQHELERAARVDYLTGCYNRRAIEELATHSMAGARRHGLPLSLLVLDIDHFKRINDELGHAIGDLALMESVARIRTTLRTEDVLGRLGGEEFIVLMPNADGASAVQAGERIRSSFSAQPLRMDGHHRTVTLSIGVATLAPMDREFSQLLQRGDRAMYAAKNAGRDLVMPDAMTGWEPPPGERAV